MHVFAATDRPLGDPVAFGRWLRAAREDRQITQQALAERAGLSRSYLSDLERGRGARPTIPTIDRLAAALGVSHVDALRAAGILDPAARDAHRQEEERLLALYRGLSESGQLMVERFLRFLYQEEQRWVQPSFAEDMFDAAEAARLGQPEQQQVISLFSLPVAGERQSE